MKIQRILQNILLPRLQTTKKIVILYGPRQVGKTTLATDILSKLHFKALAINADQKRFLDVLSSRDSQKMGRLVSGYQLLFIDEAQRIPEVGLNLKILMDSFPSLKIFVTGSSSLELASKIKEPLTGRTWTHTLYPISWKELAQGKNPFELEEQLEERLIYGSYPEIVSMNNHQDIEQLLREISSSYLYRDILDLLNLKHSNKIHDLLRLLAFQVGSEVSLAELATQLGLSQQTVDAYVHVLEQSFVLFRLRGFSKNLRKEVVKKDKIYFYDLGIRNAILDDFKPLHMRADTGALWENFLIIERLKLLSYQEKKPNMYFWRTYTGAEIDYVEETGGKLFGYEFTFRAKKKKIPATWSQVYQGIYSIIHRENFLEFIL